MPKVAWGFLATFAAVCALRLGDRYRQQLVAFRLYGFAPCLGNSLAMTRSITTAFPIAQSIFDARIIRLFDIPDNELRRICAPVASTNHVVTGRAPAVGKPRAPLLTNPQISIGHDQGGAGCTEG